MPSPLAGLRRDRTKASALMTKLATAARGRSMTDDEQRDFDAAAREVADLDEKIATAEAEAAPPESKDKTVGRAEAAEIVRLCVDGGVPTMAASMLAEGIGVEDAKARIAAAGKAKDLVALARKKDASIPIDLAATMLAEGKTVEDIRAALFDKLVAAEEKTAISSHVPLVANGGTLGRGAAQANMRAQLERRGLIAKGA